MINLFDPKHPDQLEDGAQYVMLVTFTEMFVAHTAMSQAPSSEREKLFMEFVRAWGLPADPPGEMDITITDGGFNNEPPKRMMSVAEYREYWPNRFAQARGDTTP